jgi:hypothetical protein
MPTDKVWREGESVCVCVCWDHSSAEWVNQYVCNARKKRAPFMENKQCKPSANGFALLMIMFTSRTSLRYTINND